VHVLLGLEVCPRSYEVNLRKIVHQPRTVTKLRTVVSSFDSSSSLFSKRRFKKTNTLTTPLKRLLAKCTLERKGTY
jgi:hypothetical protein